MTKTTYCTRFILIICFVAIAGLCATRSWAQTLQWGTPEKYDSGRDSYIAIHESGFIVEVHHTNRQSSDTLWYHLGRLNGSVTGGVTWGSSHLLPAEGNWPNVTISKEGYVIFVYSTGESKKSSDLNYAVGKVDPYGSLEQTIDWVYGVDRWDSGYRGSIAINNNGVIVGVHESGSGGKGLYYRVGHLNNPAGGNFQIVWDSGTYGIQYDDGVDPYIALNNLNQVVEVHKVTDEDLLHYRRGTVSGGTISFGGPPRYSDDNREPTVALLDNGTVLELESSFDDLNIYSRTGVLSTTDPERINWSPTLVKVNDSASGRAYYPSIASNAFFAVGTWTGLEESLDGNLYYSVTQVP